MRILINIISSLVFGIVVLSIIFGAISGVIWLVNLPNVKAILISTVALSLLAAFVTVVGYSSRELIPERIRNACWPKGY